MLKTLQLDVQVDARGVGSATTDELNGHVLLVVLPKNMLFHTSVTLYPEDTPDLKAVLKLKDERVFRVKMPTVDLMGDKSPEMEDIPVVGRIRADVVGAVPNAVFSIKIICNSEKKSVNVQVEEKHDIDKS